ncbi:MAG: Metal-binding protein SmbP [Nitrosomonadaceae bacterium]|nr:Metal-binding protein SmbP [Nitrosomonadaceae bacterium]
MAHGKEGHAEELVKHAETSLQFAKMGGRGSHLSEGIDHLNEAIEHGKAGHADVGTEHVEAALQHLLSEIE